MNWVLPSVAGISIVIGVFLFFYRRSVLNSRDKEVAEDLLKEVENERSRDEKGNADVVRDRRRLSDWLRLP